MSKGRILQIMAGLVLTTAGLFIFFKDLDPHVLIQELKDTRITVIIWVLFLSIVTLWLRSLRWKILLPSSPGAHKRGLFPIITIGYMVNNIMPARLGEAVRAVILWKKNGYSLTISIGSLLLERLIDSMVFLSFFFIPIFFLEQLSELIFYGLITAGIFSLVLIFFISYSFFPSGSKHLCLKLTKWLPLHFRARSEKIMGELIENLKWVFSPVKVVTVILLSFSVALCYALIIYALSDGVFNLTVLDSMFGQAFAALGTAIPLAPGFIGTVHASLQFGLSLTGIPPADTGAIIILYHALPFISVTLVGLFALAVTNITFKDITKADRALKTTQKDTDVYGRPD